MGEFACPCCGSPVPWTLPLYLAQKVRASGVSQTELAERTGFTQKHISQMMNGKSGAVEAWDKLLRAAGIELPG